MHNGIVGWDVGGAHLKAVLLNSEGQVQQVLQVPCALWRGLPELEAAIDVVLSSFAQTPLLHAVTMTGELVDLFPNRRVGVQSISRVMDAKLNGIKQFYTGALNADFAGFVSLQEVDQYWQHIASANWLASAGFVAKNVQHGLLIDIGSTTSDFVRLENNQPACIGFTDAARMQSDELVYAGVIRTPLMAVAQKVKFGDNMTSVAAEYFATTADVYRLTGDVQEADDMTDTADGKEKTQLASARRIARMIGRDVDDAPLDAWIGLAHEFKSQQATRLKNVALEHMSLIIDKNQRQEMCVVGAGTGSFLVKEIAGTMDIRYMDVAQLIAPNLADPAEAMLLATNRWASVCLPAYAVAFLALDPAGH